jgi:ParB family chromosome partitioning protein
MPDALLEIPIEQIDGRKLPLRGRVDAEDLDTLVRSVGRYGVIEPVIVRPTPDGDYELIVGRRRFEACVCLGYDTIPAIVRRVSDDRAREITFQTNLQVSLLNIADEVDFLRKADVFHLSDEQLSEQYGLTPEEASVARRFNRLSPPIREAVRTGEIDERRALALSRLERETDRTRIFRYIREHDPPVDQVEDIVNRMESGDAPQI